MLTDKAKQDWMIKAKYELGEHVGILKLLPWTVEDL